MKLMWRKLVGRALLIAVSVTLALFGVAGIVWAIGDFGHEPLARQVVLVAVVAPGVLWIIWCLAAIKLFWSEASK